MKHLKQDKEYNCGQTCVAMVAGCDIDIVEKTIGLDNTMYITQLISVCKKLKVPISEQWDIIKNWSNISSIFKKLFLPLNCFVFVKFKDEDKGHMIVRKNGKFYDPNGTKYYLTPKRYTIKAFLSIFHKSRQIDF